MDNINVEVTMKFRINDLIGRKEYQALKDENLIVNLYDLLTDMLKDEGIIGMVEDTHGVLVSVEEVE
jgi:hypothetical protein